VHAKYCYAQHGEHVSDHRHTADTESTYWTHPRRSDNATGLLSFHSSSVFCTLHLCPVQHIN